MAGAHFAQHARDYDRYRSLAPAERERWLDSIVDQGDLVPGSRVLDVGAGTGRLAVPLRRRGMAVVALDASEAMLREAGAKDPELPLILGDAHRMPLKEGSFDACLLSFVVQHLRDVTTALGEISRVAPRVVIITLVPDQSYEGDVLGEAFPSLATLDRRRFPTPRTLTGLLEALGMTAKTEERVLRRSWTTGEFLEAVRARYIATLSLLPPGEFEAGVAFLERELPRRYPRGTLDRTSRVAFVVGRHAEVDPRREVHSEQ